MYINIFLYYRSKFVKKYTTLNIYYALKYISDLTMNIEMSFCNFFVRAIFIFFPENVTKNIIPV